MGNKFPKVSYNGVLELGDLKISCAVLDNGERILVDRSLALVLGIRGGGAYWKRKKEGGAELPEYISVNYLTPFISDEQKETLVKTVVYEDKDGEVTEGISASLLVEICDIWQKADKNGALENKPNAKKAAENAYIIFKSFAKVGITALIDEATGYQYDREKDELQKILKAYISEELLPWQKKFPDEFYKELFRLNGWEYNLHGIKKRPGVIGTWTNKLIYDELPPGIKEELKIKVPISESGNKTVRYHQFLTEDIGDPHLKSQLDQILTLFRLSDNMKDMWYNFEKLKDRKRGQRVLPFEFDDKGHTIEPIDDSTLSDFNKNLKKALEYNVNDKKLLDKGKQEKLF